MDDETTEISILVRLLSVLMRRGIMFKREPVLLEPRVTWLDLAFLVLPVSFHEFLTLGRLAELGWEGEELTGKAHFLAEELGPVSSFEVFR